MTDELKERVACADRLRDAGDLDAALAAYQAIMAEFPRLAVGHFKAGTALMRMDRPEEGEQAYRTALELDPLYSEAANNLAVLCLKRGDWIEAESLLQRAVAERPDYLEAHVNLSDVLQRLGWFVGGLYHARRAAELAGDSPVAWERVGSLLNSLGRMREAIDCMERVVPCASDNPSFWTALAVAYQGLGRHDEAAAAHDKAAALAGSEFLPRMNRLYFSNYQNCAAETLWQRHRDFGAWVRERVGSPNTDFADILPVPERRLRLGFVSGDLRRHSVGYFVPGMIEHLSRSRFQLFAYHVSHYEDDATARLKPLFNVWRDVAALDHDRLYQQIRKDRIDILFDLSGHTDANRLMVFARRPAPVQVTCLGYPNTTGLDCMDYRITDAIADPPGASDRFHSESLWRLDRCFICYSPPAFAPDVAPRPADSAGAGVVFGSFNSRAKYSQECLAAWSRLLLRVPGSRLVIKSIVGNGDAAGRDELVGQFVAHGVAADRIEVMGRIDDPVKHLAAYAGIDIALDSFPYCGTTTSCEALWMGVPMVSLAGDRHASRVGASILHAVGLPELVAESVDRYVDIAAELAADPARRHALRSGMRERVQASELCDRHGMADALADTLGEMWQRYCATREGEVAAVREDAEAGEDLLRLHVGGLQAKEGWKILDAEARDGVDYVGDICDLSGFGDESCGEIYASHILEHVGQADVLPVLNEFHRMLCSGGKLYLAVPDLDVLARLFVDADLDTPARFHVMRMMFGGQQTPHDFHKMGFALDFLADYLRDAGFSCAEQVESFGMFDDTSGLVYAGEHISLNLVVTK